jgi:predicted kinase
MARASSRRPAASRATANHTGPSPVASLVPTAPGWTADWPHLTEAFGCLRALEGCAQDPVFHPEGDVATHTRLVCEALVESDAYRALGLEEATVVFLAALLHDTGKPGTTSAGADGRVTTHGHSRRGEQIARLALWRMGISPALREHVAGLVRHHQLPLHGLSDHGLKFRVHAASQRVRCDFLALLAQADVRGRRSEDRDRLEDNVELFAEYCRDVGCADGPRAFPSDHTRFLYFRREWTDPDVTAFDDTRSRVVVMSGLPGSGKDTWLARHASSLPVVSLDAVREELGVSAKDAQGPVVKRAQELARTHLRRGEPFAWNATNVSRELRARLVGFLAGYKAHVRFVHVETDEPTIQSRNRDRPRGGVPQAVLSRLAERWSPPDRTEAHEVTQA